MLPYNGTEYSVLCTLHFSNAPGFGYFEGHDISDCVGITVIVLPSKGVVGTKSLTGTSWGAVSPSVGLRGGDLGNHCFGECFIL